MSQGQMASSLPSASLGSAEGTCSSGHGKQCCEYHGLLISSRLAWTATNACLRAVAAIVNEQHIAVLRSSNQAPQRSLDVAASGLGGGLVGVNHDGDIGGLETVVGGEDILDRVNCGGTQYIAVVSIALQQAVSFPSESTDDSPAVLTIIDTPASSEVKQSRSAQGFTASHRTCTACITNLPLQFGAGARLFRFRSQPWQAVRTGAGKQAEVSSGHRLAISLHSSSARYWPPT